MIGGAAGLAACATPGLTATPRGVWRDDAGVFAIGEFPEFGQGPFGFDYGGLRVGPLISEGGSRWVMSSLLDGKGPPVAAIAIDRDRLRVGDRRLRPLTIRRTPFSAVSGEISLAAELAMPAGTRRRGTIFMIYGSGPAPKEAFDLWALWFLSSGFAVITYDKRGSGRSGGDWRRAGLVELAADARAVIERAHKIAPAGPLFAWGASQAGWIEPQLGAAGVLDGVIMHAGSAMRPAEQMLAAVEAELRAYDFPDDEIDRAKAYYALDTEVSLGRRPWTEIDAAYKTASAAGAEWLLSPPAAADAPDREMIRLMAEFDPAPFWRANRAPTLAIFGGKDWVVPASANLAALEMMVSKESALAALTLPSANHLMFVAKTGVRAEYPTLSQLDPGYFPAISDWLDRQV